MNGALVEVEHSLIKQHAKHIVDLTFGVKIILGMNGKVWLEPTHLTENSIDQIARLKSIIQILAQNFVCLRIENLIDLYNQTAAIQVQEMNSPSARETVLNHVAQTINTQNIQNVAEIIRGTTDDHRGRGAEQEEEYYE